MNSGVVEVDPHLETLVDEWKSEMKEHGIPYEDQYNKIRWIRIVDDYGVAGQCDHTNRTITVSKGQGEYTTRVILWHELGHFVFDLEHGEGIMHSHTESEEYYKEHWEEIKASYIKQIKDGVPL